MRKKLQSFNLRYLWKAACGNPVRILLGVITGISLLLLSVNILDMSLKRFVVCTCLCFGTGACIALPKWDSRINIPLLLAYLLYVPEKIFERIELPFHDLSRIVGGTPSIGMADHLCLSASFCYYIPHRACHGNRQYNSIAGLSC